jgi:hypothetical protein
MINANRIVPVQNADLLSLYATMLKIAAEVSLQISLTKLSATNPGEFAQTTSGSSVFCDEPVKKFNFGAGVSSALVYFVAAYDYEGFTVNGTPATTAGVSVEKDSSTLYSATLSNGILTFAKVGL